MTVHKPPFAIPPDVSLRFSVTSILKCPLYAVKDRFEIDEIALSMQCDKPLCLILVNDLIRQLSHAASMRHGASFHFPCSGCAGTVTVTGIMVSDFLKAMSDDQRRRVEGLIEALSRFSLFRSMDEQELKKVLPEIKAGDFEPGTVIVKKGELGRYLYIIESGSVDVLSGSSDEMVLTRLNQGEIFGEMSLLSGTPSAATFRVREPSRLLALDGDRFTRMVTRYPSLQNYLFRMLSHRLRETDDLKESQLAKGMRGSLDDLQLAELLQVLHTSRKSGQLHLRLPKGAATVTMRDGNLVAIEYDKRHDEEGFFELLKETDGSFSFNPELPSEYAERPEIGDFMQLLMEGFVRIDESSK